MQKDGRPTGPWMVELARLCEECGGSGLVSGRPAGEEEEGESERNGRPTLVRCPTCVDGKERRTVTIPELQKLLAE